MRTCVVYDDRRAAREQLGQMFGAVPGVRRTIMVASADELLARYADDPGHVVVVGTQRAVSSGLEAIVRVLARHPAAAVVAVGARDDIASARAAIAAGACGFVRWDASPAITLALLHALYAIHSSLPPIPRQPSGGAGGAASPAPGSLGAVGVQPSVQAQLGLSGREMQVLVGISQGRSNAEIAEELYLSDNTVKSHARRLFGKLGVHERAHAVACAYRSGLLTSSTSVPGPREPG